MQSQFEEAVVEAALILADGTVFRGVSVGAPVTHVAEVVFNTAMTGYQEILTDPSYTGQMVTLTGSHVGNVGVNDADTEGRLIFAEGLIVRDLPATYSNYRATDSLSNFLKAHGVPAIAQIDTRHLTQYLRTKGVQAGPLWSHKTDR